MTRKVALAKTPRRRPQLSAIDAEMQRWCARLEEELGTWSGVSTRPMFGLAGYYRDGRIFAAIPRTRAVDTPFSLLIKLPGTRHPQLQHGRGPGADWVTCTLHSEADLADALRHLARAYAKARGPR